MLNWVQDCDKIVLTAPGVLASGDPFIVGDIIAVAESAAASGASVVGVLEGVFDLSVKGVNDDGNVAVSKGDKLYYTDGDTPKISKKSSGRYFGKALEAVDSGSTSTINVLKACGGAG